MIRDQNWLPLGEYLHRLGLLSLEGTTEVYMTEVRTVPRDRERVSVKISSWASSEVSRR